MTVDHRECYIYTVSGGDGLIKKSKEKKLIDFNFGEHFANQDPKDFKVCNCHVAVNGRFFAIGLVN